jgi:hypothetical protein
VRQHVGIRDLPFVAALPDHLAGQPGIRPDAAAPGPQLYDPRVRHQDRGDLDADGQLGQLFAAGRANNFKEQELLPDFLTLYFHGVLGEFNGTPR